MTFKKLLILLCLIGLGCLMYSFTLPYYTDPKAVSDTITEINQDKDLYYKAVKQFKTDKLAIMDFGSWLTIFSFTVLIFMVLMHIKNLSDWKKLYSCSKKTLFITVNIAGLMMIPGTIWYYWFRLTRWDYLPFADSIGIPIGSGILMALVLIVLSNLFILLLTWRSHLPVKLFIRAKHYGIWTILLELFFGLCFILNFLLILASIVDGDHFMIPFNLFYTYTFLVLRAGKIDEL